MLKLKSEIIQNILKISDYISTGDIKGVSTDSRNITKDCLFVPISGNHFDGHKFILQAFTDGASFSLCNKSFFNDSNELQNYKNRLFLVEDTQKAYFSIMSYWRDQFPYVICIGIGGTVGKTTTKEFLRRILEEDGETVYTKANLNAPLGMCLAVNNLQKSTKYLVCEMGTDSFGEITTEASIVKPSIGVCLSVGPTHAELLGGSINGVAKAESELIEYLKDSSIVFLNKDNQYVYKMRSLVGNSKIKYFGKKDADITYANYKIDQDGMTLDLNIISSIFVPTYGEGNAYNLMAAIGIAKELGVTDKNIKEGLKKYIPEHGRLNFFKYKNAEIQNDSYNANLESMKQSIDVFLELSKSKHRIFVLGDMRELGMHADENHQELMQLIKSAKPDILIYIGDYGKFMEENLKGVVSDISIFSNIDTSNAYKITDLNEIERIKNILDSKIRNDSWILFKGSLGTGLWKIPELIIKETN